MGTHDSLIVLAVFPQIYESINTLRNDIIWDESSITTLLQHQETDEKELSFAP